MLNFFLNIQKSLILLCFVDCSFLFMFNWFTNSFIYELFYFAPFALFKSFPTKYLQVTQKQFQDFAHGLEELHLVNAGLTSIHRNAFAHIPSVSTMDLSNNRVTYPFTKRVCQQLWPSYLRVLWWFRENGPATQKMLLASKVVKQVYF